MLDLLGYADKDLQVFCIHDAAAFGTRIDQALQEETDARPGRKVEVINLGLDPWEAVEMGLEVEKVNRKGKREATVGDYVDDPYWHDWLQENRIELNAMSTPQFLEWLDRKFEPYAGKVVPPPEVLEAHLAAVVREFLRERITAEVLARADIAGKVERAYRMHEPDILRLNPILGDAIVQHLGIHPADLWDEPMWAMALSIITGSGLACAA